MNQLIDQGSALEFWIRSNHASISNFARGLFANRKEQLAPLFDGDFSVSQVRAKIDWLKKKRQFDTDDLYQIEHIYGIDPDQMFSKYAKAKGIEIHGNNNIAGSSKASINVNNDPALEIENTFLRREIETLKRQIEMYEKTIETLNKALG